MKMRIGYGVGILVVLAMHGYGQQDTGAAAAANPPAATPPAAQAEPVMAGFGKVKLTGLLQGWFQYDQGQTPESTFRLRRAELKASGDIAPDIAWWLMVDPAQVREDDTKTAKISGTNYLTAAGRKSVLQDFAVSLTCPLSGVKADVGQYKVPFGMEGLESSAKLDFIERAALASQLKWADARDVGLTLKKDLTVGGVKLQPAVGLYNGEGQNKLDANDGKTVVGRLVVSPLSGLHVGAAYYDGEVGAARTENRRTGFEARYTAGPASLYGEYATGKSDGKDKSTYYVTATYKVAEAVQLAARYDTYDPDTDKDDDAKTETSAGVNVFLVKHNAKVQLNYVFRGEEGPSKDDDVVRVNVQSSF